MYSTYGYNYPTTTTTVDSTGLAVFAGLYIVYMIVCLAIAVVTIIGMWKLFVKAGKEGWKSLIPVYNLYTLCEIVGVSPWWILIIFVGGLVCIIPIIGWLAYMAAAIYFGILLAKSTANAFGKDTGFAVGLYFLAPIFFCILGFGKAKYVGANPMNDIIFKKK